MNTPTAPTGSLPHWKDGFADPKAVWGLAVFFLLLGVLFYERIAAIALVWRVDANYSHGFLIIPISVGLAYYHLKNLQVPLAPQPLLGGLVLALGLLLVIVTSIYRMMIMDFPALAAILYGAALMIGGRAWASALLFPILFLFFMFPLPMTWTNFTAVWLQDLVSTVSGRILELAFVCHQQGNTIFLAGANEPIYVGQECSGLRQLVSFVALGTLVGHLSNRGVVFSLLMIVAAVPVAIISNVLRVLLMALAIRYLGAQAVSGWLHDVPAVLTLPVGLLLFFAIHRGIGGVFAKRGVVPEVKP